MSEIRATMEHVRAARFCSAGLRTWLKHHDIDVDAFLREGVPVERLEATGDAFGLHVAAIARKTAAQPDAMRPARFKAPPLTFDEWRARASRDDTA